MVRKSSTYALVIPCLNTQVIKAQSIRRIESILREGLETIEEGGGWEEEEEDPMTPSPSPLPLPSPAAAALVKAAMNGRQIQRKMSLQKRTVSARLQKARSGSGGCGPLRWRVRISRFSTVISAPLSTLGDSYVRMMNGFAHRGGPSLGELAVFNTSLDAPLLGPSPL